MDELEIYTVVYPLFWTENAFFLVVEIENIKTPFIFNKIIIIFKKKISTK